MKYVDLCASHWEMTLSVQMHLTMKKTSVSSEDSETRTWVTGAFKVMEETLLFLATKEYPETDSKSFKKQ